MHSLLYLYLSRLILPSKLISHRLPFTAQPAYLVLVLAFVPLLLESASLGHATPQVFSHLSDDPP